ncbi:MAG: UDP-N-acetylglucosamine 2-epimerase (non-hydrolyzing) [Bacteroidetes bacterium]|nr:UDP-N-acetylglucosamine 2-epimerase (non-hydrolyzing) [Bacteroidota bacterium]
MKKILVIAGTRPEIIKLAPIIILAKQNYKNKIKIEFCFTGQHKKMAAVVLKFFNLKPNYILSIMQDSQSIDNIASQVFNKMPKIFESAKPEVVIVQGDTTTAVMSAICAFQNKIPIAHVEAGLRTYNYNSPFPEEFNRKTISTISNYNFCPTIKSKNNLLKEGIIKSKIYLVGNTVVDAIKIIINKNRNLKLTEKNRNIKSPYILITAHRRESFGKEFENICFAIKESALKNPNINFVYPVHLNPNVQKPVKNILEKIKNIILIEPVNYLQLLTLIKNSLFVLTDSGGIQEEAPSFNKFTIVMRKFTERTESIDLGISELVGTDPQKICKAIERQIQNPFTKKVINPFGDGFASERILKILSN